MNYKKLKWDPWFKPQGSMISQIRFSKCGTYVEKEYNCADIAANTLDNQLEHGTLGAWFGTTPERYISERVETIDEEFADILTEELEICDHQDLIEYYNDDMLEEFLKDVAEVAEGYEEIATRVFDASHGSYFLDFGDNHWGNIGYCPNGSDSFVCIDYDEVNYEEIS